MGARGFMAYLPNAVVKLRAYLTTSFDLIYGNGRKSTGGAKRSKNSMIMG